jgi:dienelactone hydrolase
MRRMALLLSLPALLLVAQPAQSMTSEMTLKTADGFVLSGTLNVPEGRGKHPVVILAHQFGADRSGWDRLASRLNDRGIATLALDLRGHGRSTDRGGATVAVTGDFMGSASAVGFDQIPSDIVQVAGWVRKQKGIDGRHLGLAGSSVGAFSILLAAPKVQPTTLLALSPAGMGAFGADARERMVAATTKAHAALMVFVSTGDKEANENVEPLRPILGANIRTFEGNRHGFDFMADYGDVMAVFFAEYLLHPHTGLGTPAASPKAKSNATVLTPPAPAGAPAAAKP